MAVQYKHVLAKVLFLNGFPMFLVYINPSDLLPLDLLLGYITLMHFLMLQPTLACCRRVLALF